MSARFTGDARLQELHRFDEGPVRISLVSFPAGVTTNWHHHTGGQLLVVTSGTAQVKERGGEVTLVGAGESSFVEPDVEHWHGATDDGPMTHIAISCIDTVWGEPPE